MTDSNQIKGFALLCDKSGIIKSVLRDDFNLSDRNPIGKLFINFIDKRSQNRALNFLHEIKRNNFSIDHRLSIIIKEKTYSLYFIGIELDNDIIIVAANNQREAIDYTDHLQQINNEQANQIRELLKKENQRLETSEETQHLFDEISKLNNNLVNLQRELTRKNVELKRLDDIKNGFIGMAAHDLRSPLGNIRNFSEFLLEDLENDLTDQQLNFLKKILESSEFMLALVEDLLDLSKIESGKIQMTMQVFDVAQKLKNTVENYNILSQRKKIKIFLNAEPKVIQIKADPNKIEQVVQNLIDNAIKFSPEDTIINVGLEEKQNHILIMVKDHGKGIKKEDQDKVFIPFTTIGKMGTAGEKSTGLGMSIVKKIVEAHNGGIRLESEPDKGTTFFVELPKGS